MMLDGRWDPAKGSDGVEAVGLEIQSAREDSWAMGELQHTISIKDVVIAALEFNSRRLSCLDACTYTFCVANTIRA